MADAIHLPPWAIGRARPGQYDQLGAQLPTRDGRRIGNAVVIAVGVESHGISTTEIETDAGTRKRLTVGELRELFHEPEWIMDAAQWPPRATPYERRFSTMPTDPTAQTEPLTIGQQVVAAWETDAIAEPCELAAAIDMAIRDRQHLCAHLVESRETLAKHTTAEIESELASVSPEALAALAAAIRSLP